MKDVIETCVWFLILILGLLSASVGDYLGAIYLFLFLIIWLLLEIVKYLKKLVDRPINITNNINAHMDVKKIIDHLAKIFKRNNLFVIKK